MFRRSRFGIFNDEFRQRWLLGCGSVPCFFQISGETPATNGLLHLISDGQHAPGSHLAGDELPLELPGVRGWAGDGKR